MTLTPPPNPQMAQVDGSLWVKLDKESMAHYCENTEGEAWSLAQGKGLMYLIHEADLTSADREKARKSRPFLFFGDSSKHRNKVSGFDFKNAQATPAMGFAPTSKCIIFEFQKLNKTSADIRANDFSFQKSGNSI